MPVDPPARNQAFSNCQLGWQRQIALVAASNAETIQNNPLNPPPGPSHAALAQRARQERERAQREAAAQAVQASRFKPPHVALILEEPPHAPLDPPQILGNQHVPVNIEDNQNLDTITLDRGTCMPTHRAPEGQQPQYAQLYLYDPHDAANFCTRNQHNAGIDPGLMCLLTGVIHESHELCPLFFASSGTLTQGDTIPTSDEIALILADNALNQQHDIVLFKHDGGFQRMSSWNPAYACLHYVLLFPKGEHGFQRHIPIQGWQWQPGLHPQAAQRVAQLDVEGHEPDDDEEDNGPAGNQRQRRIVVSEREYYAYYLFSCEDPDVQTHYPGANGTFSTIFWAGHLFQQYLVDVWAIADQSRLLGYTTTNLHSEWSCWLLFLPSSYYGGPQQMAESYQDAMAISCYLGGPQLFITMTANPKWPEIHSALLPGQTYSDRPDLITWVFELKRRQLMEDIIKKGFWEMHCTLWLEHASHILEPGDVELICAELPIAEGPGADPALYSVVTSSMLHGPCGPDHSDAPCWDKDKKACTKGYYPLKQWNAQTIMVADSYPSTGVGTTVKLSERLLVGLKLPLIIDMLFPTIHSCPKGTLAISMWRHALGLGQSNMSSRDAQQDQNLDEIRTHLDACWVSPYEALWQL
ncbi:Helitron helicase-like domain at N-terminus [Rhizoctonia solani]|uniref:Helitron helicase-like domain at N-terminus n=1 Tax=Rhizoctonia solani TaxID=456999 RepID=A0A8H8NSC6_9AGAM|nr:Helitron helicase-like domain at N-terminus [Rhizoctonia solani]QRW17526.1 Helitron helicase-like domain at N-terminus [Rhizoctonia solani]